MTYQMRGWAVALQALVALMLGACAGGGGGGGGNVVSPPPPPPPLGPTFPPLAPPHAPGDFPNITGAEFSANWGVGGTNAQIAWQNGATGEGVLVGVIDDGIHPSHPELVGRISPDSTDIVAGRNALVTNESHGSELSSLIVGNYNNAQTVGVAFDATILAVRADNGAGQFSNADLANAIDYARLHDVDVINLSLGSSSPSPQVFRDALQRATQAGIIVVVSAGNDGNAGAVAPNYPAFFATDATISSGLIIVSGGLNPDGGVNPASNPPGSAANWYLTAPGWQIIVPDYGPAGPVPGFQTCGLGPNGDLCRIQGTSYASPHIAGAVALIKDGFPGMTPNQIVDLLFTTADDTGAPGTDGVNGRGRLNIGRAFGPVGPLAVPLFAAETSIGVDTPLGVTGAPFGDGIYSNAAWRVVGFDRYQRTFAVDLGDNWIAPSGAPAGVVEAPRLWRSGAVAPGVGVQMALAESVAPDSYRLPVDRADLERTPVRIQAELAPGLSMTMAMHGARASYRETDAVSHLDFVAADVSLQLTQRVTDELSLTFLSDSGVAPAAPAFSAMDLMREPAERTATATRADLNFGAFSFNVSAGQISEERSLLGLSWSDAFGDTPRGETRFAGLGWRYAPSDAWRINFYAEFGVADLAQTSWLRVAAPLRTSSYSFSVEHDATPPWLADVAGGQGTVRFSVSQPLRVDAGTLSFMAPTATKYGRQSLQYETRSFEPTPSGRELRLGLGYNYFAGDSVSAFGEALYVLDPGHVDGTDDAAVLRLGVRVAH